MRSQLSLKKLLIVPAALLLTFSVAGCRVNQTEEGALPNVDVDVDAEAGKLPAYEVEGPDVTLDTEEKSITVPEVNVSTQETDITVPTIDIDLPGGEEDAEAAE